MVNRFTTAQSAVAMRRWGPPAIVTLAAMAALTALAADAAARQARPAPLTETTAPRDAREPIIAIVSIKTQQVTFSHAEGGILRACVSRGSRGAPGAGKAAPARGQGGGKAGGGGEETRRHSGARNSIAHGVAAQAGMAQDPRRRRTRLRRQDARHRKDRSSQGAGRRAEAEGRP